MTNPLFRLGFRVTRTGESPSGRAAAFGAAIRRFESSLPSQRARRASLVGPASATISYKSKYRRAVIRRCDHGFMTHMTIDTGNTGFMLLCSSLVMLMTPGLAFFYGGLVGRKNVLAIMIQSFISLCWTTVVWYVCGYSLCFSGDVGGVIGNLDMAFLRGVNLMAPSPNDSIPLIVHVAYQMM